jgi:type II secretory pathway pseudopilin PulG
MSGEERTMRGQPVSDRRGERGSALIIAVLITVILSLLGISYMLMAQTENTIAENERNAATALYAAQSAVSLAVSWINDPSSTGYLVPTTGQVDRSLRLLDTDSNPATPRVLAVSGDATKPIYKDATVTPSALFDRPYRSGMGDTFMGIETGTDADPNNAARGPDLVVSSSHLDTINTALFPNFPSPSLRAKITRIEIYSPPLISIGGSSTRMGIATVKASAGVFIFPGTAQERQVATRIVKAVVNEIPIPGPGGPLQSCADLNYNGNFQIHWGAGASATTASLGITSGNIDNKAATGVPYAFNDPTNYYNDPLATPPYTLAQWALNNNGQAIDDPWFKFLAGGALTGNTYPAGCVATDTQPCHFVTTSTPANDHSNLFQNTPSNCPTFDYNLWKAISQSHNKNNYYFAYDSATQMFKMDGTGTAQDMPTWIQARKGLMFFDTADGQVPVFGSNLTPSIGISGNSWWSQGFIYLNASNFGTTGAAGGGHPQTIVPPGEPGDGSGFVNLHYPSTLGGNYTIRNATVDFQSYQDPTTGDWYCTDALQCDATARTASATPVKDNLGLAFQDNINFDGVFYTSGTFTAQGNANYYGSLIANSGVLDGGGTPSFYFDERLIKGGWPPKDLGLPRVVISAWQTDL